MMRSEYMVILNNTIIVDCCEQRKAELSNDWQVTVAAYGENITEVTRHCGIKPCLKGAR